MKIDDFLEKITVKINRDIKPHFKLTKKFNKNTTEHNGCLNCKDEHNQTFLRSEAWTAVQYCWACNHLNVIYYQDRMGGVYEDVIECYTEKDDEI